jgi:hypothetical protein
MLGLSATQASLLFRILQVCFALSLPEAVRMRESVTKLWKKEKRRE